jgi:putative hydrolase of the HAD superfamily
MLTGKETPEFEAIGFDADDTLWENETLFYNAQKRFQDLLKDQTDQSLQELLKIEKQNLEFYGYGIKGFILSLIETSIKISNGKIDNESIVEFLKLGKEMLSDPVQILPDVKSTLEFLSKYYILILITKGDLLDQEKKISNSNLSKYFNYIEIVSEKNETTYSKILTKYKINPRNFLMVGNSLKSDIMPVNNVGGKGIYIPFKLTWEHEIVKYNSEDYVQLKNISCIRSLLAKKQTYDKSS